MSNARGMIRSRRTNRLARIRPRAASAESASRLGFGRRTPSLFHMRLREPHAASLQAWLERNVSMVAMALATAAYLPCGFVDAPVQDALLAGVAMLLGARQIAAIFL